MASLCEQYKKALEIIFKEEGELKDDTYLDKLLDCTGESLSSMKQLQEWEIFPFVRSAFSEDSPDALKVFAIRLCSIIVSQVPNQVLPVLQLVPRTLYSPNQEISVVFSICDFLLYLFESKCETSLLNIGELCVNVGIWNNFLKPLMMGNVGKSLYLNKIIENLTVSLVIALRRAFEARSKNQGASNNELFSNFSKVVDHIMEDLLKPTDITGVFILKLKPLIRLVSGSRVNKSLFNMDDVENLTKSLMGSLKSGTLSKNCNYSGSKDILELLVYLVEDVAPEDPVNELLNIILSSGKYPESAVKAAIFVSLKHHKRFRTLGTMFLDSLHQEEKLDKLVLFCIFTISVLNSLEIFQFDYISVKVMHVFEACELDEDGKDLTSDLEVKLLRNLIMFLKNSLGNSSSVSSSIIAYHKPMLHVLQRYMGVSDSLKSDLLVFLTTAFKIMKQCENMPETVRIVLGQASSVSWDIRDSALACIASILSNKHLNTMLNNQDSTKIKHVIQIAKKDANSFIRASAFQTLNVFIGNIGLGHFDETKFVEDLESCLDNDTEAIVRREAVKLAERFYHTLLEDGKDQNIKAIENLMIKALFDFDWEVKVNVVRFWKSTIRFIINQCKDSNPLVNLADRGCLTAIAVAVDDYEHLVISEARELVAMVRDFANVEGKCKCRKIEYSVEVKHCQNSKELVEECSSEIEDVIDAIVSRKNEDLIKDLMEEDSTRGAIKNSEMRNVISKTNIRHFSPETFVLFLSDFDARCCVKEPPCKLASVLGDILESARGTGLVEDIDCY